MGKCIFCGESAGFLRRAHKECQIKNDREQREREASKQLILSEIEVAGVSKRDLPLLKQKITKMAESHKIDSSILESLVICGWENLVERAFDDGILTEEEESNLTKLKEYFSLSEIQLDRRGVFTKMLKGSVLRDLMNGILPENEKIDRNLPFNFQKGEKAIWVFQDVDYYEQKKRIEYVGGSQGVSIRIAKGLYYRTGSFKGERVETEETIHADTGTLCVTNKHVYFSGVTKGFRIKHDKIVSLQLFSDGIGLQRDLATAKPQSFVTGDGWFIYNLITNATQL